jgi:serine/threonine protein kinase
LYEVPLTHDLIAVKFIDSEVTRASDGSSAFFRAINALVLRVHPCVLPIVGYCVSARGFPARIGTESAAGGSLPRLDDPGKAIVAVGIVIGMQFIHSRGVVHRDLKPANVLVDERGHTKIGDLGRSRSCRWRPTMRSGVDTPLFMAPKACETADYTAANDESRQQCQATAPLSGTKNGS